MRKKMLIILIFILFITGCSQEVNLIEMKNDYFTIYENDNISIKISNTVEDGANIYNTVLENLQKINEFSPIHKIKIDIAGKYVIPDVEDSIKCNGNFTNTEEFKKELIRKSYDIYDNWISEGLYGKIFDTETKDTDFSRYYKNNEFSLFGVRFFEPFSSKEEIQNVTSASVDLVEYLIKKGKKDELLENKIELSDIEEWAKDKKIDLSYQKNIENLMNRMEVNKLRPNSFLTINTKENNNGFTIDILTMDEQYDTAKKIEETILNFDVDIMKIREGIREDAPNFYNEYSNELNNVPKIHYYFDNNSKVSTAEMGKGRINLTNLDAQPHEYSHILMADPFLENNIKVDKPRWLDEGTASYLDFAYSDSFKFRLERFYTSFVKTSLSFEGKLNEYEKLTKNISKILEANNIDLSNPDEIMKNKSERIKVCHIIYLPGLKYSELMGFDPSIKDTVFVLGEPNRIGQKSWPMDAGNYINYHANFSFSNYLIHEYGLEKILYLSLEDFSTLTYEEVFGKSYEELKADWIKYLKNNIKDIELIL